MRRHVCAAMLAALLSTGCAQQKLTDTGVNSALTPVEAARDIASARGQTVRWGGIIVSSSNLKDHTQLEVLAYPLNEDGRPEGTSPLGRFIAVKPGYLETVDYAPGRAVTVTGTVQETRGGQVGEASYTYPVITIDQTRLWPEETRSGDSRFHFGIGVGIGL